MTKKVIQIRQTENVLQLSWILNNICSNSCSYCPPHLHAGKNHHYEWDMAKSFINRLLARYKKIHCSISGGEPSMSPFFPELVKLFYDAGHSIGVTSNGVRSLRYWSEITPYLGYICFSYHPEFEDKFLLDKAILASKYTSVCIRVMIDNRYWDKCMKAFEEFSKVPTIRTEAVRILSEMADRHIGNTYTSEQEDWLKNTPAVDAAVEIYNKNPMYRPGRTFSEFSFDDGTVGKGDTNFIINSNQNDFRGWACNIGLESLFIMYDGWVKKANCFQGGPLFHINDHENYELPTTAEICTQSICHCGTDILISKVPVMAKDHLYVRTHLNNRHVKSQQEYDLAYRDFTKKRIPIKVDPTQL